MSVFDKDKRYVMGTYNRYPVVFVKGKGCRLWDENGRSYLDMLAGIAVCNLGHCHPKVSSAVCRQAETLMHTSNLFHIPPQAELARLICENSFGSKVFFCNSGAEANEAAVKLARRYAAESGKGFKILAFKNSFHGRTVGSVSLTGQSKYREGFGELMPGVVFANFNDTKDVEKKLSEQFCAVIVEPIQGEGGVLPAEPEFLKFLRDKTRELEIPLIFDEVQTGIGRTGKLFAYEHYGVEPDVMTLAKALGNGVPIGAVVANEKFSGVLKPGTHASTFGGNYLACAAGIEVLKEISNEDFLRSVREKGQFLASSLKALKDEFPSKILQVRGKGLMIGVVVSFPCADFVKKALQKGLIINCTAGNVIRLTPPLVISYEELEEALAILRELFESQ